MDTIQHSSQRYRFFCLFACAALVLIGLALSITYNRTTQLTCLRSTGQCVLSRIEVLPGPAVTFRLEDIQEAKIEHTEQTDSADPIFYRAVIILRDQTLPLTSDQYHGDNVYGSMQGYAMQINQFIASPDDPELSFQILDPRLQDRYCGIFFLIAGLVYAAINLRTILGKPGAALKKREAQPGGADAVAAPDANETMLGEPAECRTDIHYLKIWMFWLIVPPAALGITCWLLSSLFPLIFHTNFDILFAILFSPLLLLAFFGPQAWIIKRQNLGGGGGPAGWAYSVMAIAVITGALMLFGGLTLFLVMLIAVEALVFWRQEKDGGGWLVSGWYSCMGALGLFWITQVTPYWDPFDAFQSATAQGWLSIEGLIYGAMIGLPQWLFWRRRAEHASWWVLGSALAGMSVVSITSIYITLLESQPVSISWIQKNFLWLAPFLYSAISGLALIGMLSQRKPVSPQPGLPQVEGEKLPDQGTARIG